MEALSLLYYHSNAPTAVTLLQSYLVQSALVKGDMAREREIIVAGIQATTLFDASGNSAKIWRQA